MSNLHAVHQYNKPIIEWVLPENLYVYLMKLFCWIIVLLLSLQLSAQRMPDKIYMPNIKTVKLYQFNNQESLPILKLNSQDQMELHFDDLDGYAKDYYYTFQLCDADWQPNDLNPFDYIKGFTENHLNEYRFSSIATTRYVHYQMLLPESSTIPSKSGNYLLKVYLNGDTSQLAFTKRFFVLSTQAFVNAQVTQPLDNQLFRTHQKINLTINASQLNPVNASQQIKLAVVQNYRWDNAITNLQPTFIRDNMLEYSNENDAVFPAGKEYRWADIRSFRYMSDRLHTVDTINKQLQVYLRPDFPRTKQPYLYFKDLDGWFDISTNDPVNNWWQTDYAMVHFTYVPENNQPLEKKNVYLLGELTGNNIDEDAKLQYNAAKGVYEKNMLLKQGYYSYTYVTKDNKADAIADVTLTDGNAWETENTYLIFVYYRSLSDRHDELVAIHMFNSRMGKL